jgi:hypothetical protein
LQGRPDCHSDNADHQSIPGKNPASAAWGRHRRFETQALQDLAEIGSLVGVRRLDGRHGCRIGQVDRRQFLVALQIGIELRDG